MDYTDMYKKATKAHRVLELFKGTPGGVVIDADTILADLAEKADFHESGIAAEVIDIWAKSEDQKSVERLFELLLDVGFEEYLDICIQKTTVRPAESKK